MVHIALLMMVKNEEKRLHVTLESVKGHVDSLIIYDTGSTDSTIDILQQFSEKSDIPLHLKKGHFVNFATSRNVSLDYADSIDGIDYLLLLDCNDELKGGNELRQWIQTSARPDETAWLVHQKWFSGAITDYYNIRLIRPRNEWRYRGVVHEWMQHGNDTEYVERQKVGEPIHIFQDRTLDDGKSGKRFVQDRIMLLDEYKKNPKDERTVFYLAQTCGCLHLTEEAYKYFSIRSKMGGFREETFHSFLKMGDMIRQKAWNKTLAPTERKKWWDIALAHYMNAFELFVRAEPLTFIAEYYMSLGNNLLAYHFAKFACELSYPSDSILFVDTNVYEYTRYHVLGIVAFYCEKFQEGYDACQKAIEARHQQRDIDNLKFYKDRLK